MFLYKGFILVVDIEKGLSRDLSILLIIKGNEW